MDVYFSRGTSDQFDALIARLASDPAFASALAAATTPEDAQRIAAEHGFDVTPGELAAATSNGDLSDAELDGVSGGKFTWGLKPC